MIAWRILIVSAIFLACVAALYPHRFVAWERAHGPGADYPDRLYFQMYLARRDLALSESLPKNDPQRLQTLIDVAQNFWYQTRYKEAEQILNDVLKTHGKPGQGAEYDDLYARAKLALAGVHRDCGAVDKSLADYKAMYAYDRTRTDDKSAARIARDWNNLGVAYYLMGSSKDSIAQGADDYRNALDAFDHAIKSYRKLDGFESQQEAMCLYHESIVLRDMGYVESGRATAMRAGNIMAKAPRACRLP